MATFNEILADKSKYPDSTKVTMMDGAEVTLGELRSGHMKDADYRQKTAALANERRSLESEREQWMQSKAEAEAELKQLATELITKKPEIQKDELMDELRANPVTNKLLEELSSTKAAIAKQNETIENINKELSSYKQSLVTQYHLQSLGSIRARKYKDLSDPEWREKQDALIAFAQQRRIPNLVDAETLMTHEQELNDSVAKAKEEGKLEGIKLGKAEASQPKIPFRRLVDSKPAEGMPQTVDEAFNAAGQDPEILQSLAEIGG